MSKITDMDLYGMLELERTATAAEVRKAYRKKALKCHPDKNPDDPKAAETFQLLAKVLEVLLDDAARKAYDQLLIAKEAAKKRHRDLDDRRKRFKEDLEARERASASAVPEEVKLQREIERLRKEGAKLVQEEIKLLNEELFADLSAPVKSRDPKACQLKVQWVKDNTAECSYTEESLRRIFSKYGNIEALAVMDKKAVVEFEEEGAAALAVKIEVGFVENPLSVNYASSKMRKMKNGSSIINERDSESLSERAKRQAEERRRLVEQMMKDDGE